MRIFDDEGGGENRSSNLSALPLVNFGDAWVEETYIRAVADKSPDKARALGWLLMLTTAWDRAGRRTYKRKLDGTAKTCGSRFGLG